MQLSNRRTALRTCSLMRFRFNYISLISSRLPAPCFTKHTNITCRRSFINVPPVLLTPLVFTGLVLALWTWKCFMMIVFQNKIIYMPGLPPNARREKISDYINQCGGITWREEKIVTTDRTQIALATASVESSGELVDSSESSHVYILYFQGNASSLPSRLPFLSSILRHLRADAVNYKVSENYGIAKAVKGSVPVRYTMICVSYRGYWTSNGRPSERGIAEDAAAGLDWIRSKQKTDLCHRVPVILWGQSIGAGVATGLAARHELFSRNLILRMLILETPFTSIRDMLVAIYPQKWLPYRYLWPFLWNHLDSMRALEQVAQKPSADLPEVVLLEAGRDELVPKSHGDTLERRCIDLGFRVQRHVVSGALHTEVLTRPEGRAVAAKAVGRVATSMDR